MFFFEQLQNKLLYFLCHSRKNWDGEPAVSGMVMAWRPVRLKFNKSCTRLSGLSRLFPRFWRIGFSAIAARGLGVGLLTCLAGAFLPDRCKLWGRSSRFLRLKLKNLKTT